MSINATIRAGQEIVVKHQDVAIFHRTKEDLHLVSWNYVKCPLRRDVDVLTAHVTHSGRTFQIWFLDTQLDVKLSAEIIAKLQNVKLVKIEYDIPAVVSRNPRNYTDHKGNSFDHPSNWMWKHGVRTTKSVWLLPEENVPNDRLRSFTRWGCTWHKDTIDNSEVLKNVQRAVIQLRCEYASAIESRVNGFAAAEQRRADRNVNCGEGSAERRLSDGRYEADMIRVQKTYDDKLDDLRNGASVLGIPWNWVIGTEAAVVATVREDSPSPRSVASMTARTGRTVDAENVERICAAAETLRVAGHTAVADALESSKMPKDIAQDFADDNGIEFKDEDDNVYRLTDEIE